MALNLADRLAVRAVIMPRCVASIVQYANYIMGNGAATANQIVWAKEALRIPSTMADQVSYYILNAPDFIANGSDITDLQLQGVVEAAINNHFIVSA